MGRGLCAADGGLGDWCAVDVTQSTQKVKHMNTTALVPAGVDRTNPFANAVVRRNSNGTPMGKRLSFLQDVPAGDIRKHLKAADASLKGKALTSAVDKVLHGDTTLPWVILDATVSAARGMGFVPLVGDMNKGQTKLTLKFERATTTIDKETAKQAAQAQLSDDELLEIIKLRKEINLAAKPADKTPAPATK